MKFSKDYQTPEVSVDRHGRVCLIICYEGGCSKTWLPLDDAKHMLGEMFSAVARAELMLGKTGAQ